MANLAHKIKLCFIQLGKPTQNTTLEERFNGIYRKELLNARLFTDLEQVRDQTQQWIWGYNNVRPHESLGNKPLVAFLKQRELTVPCLKLGMHLKEKKLYLPTLRFRGVLQTHMTSEIFMVTKVLIDLFIKTQVDKKDRCTNRFTRTIQRISSFDLHRKYRNFIL